MTNICELLCPLLFIRVGIFSTLILLCTVILRGFRQLTAIRRLTSTGFQLSFGLPGATEHMFIQSNNCSARDGNMLFKI